MQHFRNGIAPHDNILHPNSMSCNSRSTATNSRRDFDVFNDNEFHVGSGEGTSDRLLFLKDSSGLKFLILPKNLYPDFCKIYTLAT